MCKRNYLCLGTQYLFGSWNTNSSAWSVNKQAAEADIIVYIINVANLAQFLETCCIIVVIVFYANILYIQWNDFVKNNFTLCVTRKCVPAFSCALIHINIIYPSLAIAVLCICVTDACMIRAARDVRESNAWGRMARVLHKLLWRHIPRAWGNIAHNNIAIYYSNVSYCCDSIDICLRRW